MFTGVYHHRGSFVRCYYSSRGREIRARGREGGQGGGDGDGEISDDVRMCCLAPHLDSLSCTYSPPPQ